ncbi:MAG: YceI family protein [bacterium]|nr:YceI family protein [bacterium]
MKSPLPIILAVIAIVLIALFALQTKPDAETNTSPVNDATGDVTADGSEVALSFTLPDTVSYTANIDESVLTWESGRIVGAPYIGTVQLANGTLTREEGIITEGKFVIDMTTIAFPDNERVESHLLNADFFDVENYPTSTIVITNISMNDDDMYMASGELTILDTTNEISFPVTFTEVDNHVIANAEFEIDRTEWGITYESSNFFQNLGDKAIKNMIGFTLDLTLETATE